MMRPLSTAPKLLRRRGFLGEAGFSKKFRASSTSLRRNWKTVPWKVFDPADGRDNLCSALRTEICVVIGRLHAEFLQRLDRWPHAHLSVHGGPQGRAIQDDPVVVDLLAVCRDSESSVWLPASPHPSPARHL